MKSVPQAQELCIIQTMNDQNDECMYIARSSAFLFIVLLLVSVFSVSTVSLKLRDININVPNFNDFASLPNTSYEPLPDAVPTAIGLPNVATKLTQKVASAVVPTAAVSHLLSPLSPVKAADLFMPVSPPAIAKNTQRVSSQIVSPATPSPQMTLKQLAGPYVQMVNHAAQIQHLPVRLIAAVVFVETRASAKMRVSDRGAIGPMQLMPITAWDVLKINPWNRQQNIDGGSAYIKQLITRFGSVKEALIAYNAGPGNVVRGNPAKAAVSYANEVLSLAARSS